MGTRRPRGHGAVLDRQVLELAGRRVDVITKNIRHLYLRILPPDGRVQVTVSPHHTRAQVEAFLVSRRAWIDAQSARLHRRLPDAGQVFVWGLPRRLIVVPVRRAAPAELGPDTLRLPVRSPAETAGTRPGAPGMDAPGVGPAAAESGQGADPPRPHADDAAREAAYRAFLLDAVRAAAEPMFRERQAAWDLPLRRVSYRYMTSRWGSCTHSTGDIRISTRLAEWPPVFLEYVVTHELAHLVHPDHGAGFQRFLDATFPRWRDVRRTLNSASPADLWAATHAEK